MQAFAEDWAQEILFVGRGKHKSRWQRTRVVNQVHLLGREILIGVSCHACANRDKQHLVLTSSPTEVEWFDSRHQKQLKSRIVIHGDTAVHEDEFVLADVDYFRREIGRGSGTRPHELPER